MTKYDIPSTGVKAKILGPLLIWGLPTLAWILLIVGWLFFARTSSTDKTAEAHDKQFPARETQAATQPAVQQPTTSQVAPVPQTTPATAQTTPASPAVAATVSEFALFPKTPYSFTSAVSKLGLPNEASCVTGILVDPMSRKVLWATSANKAVPIASMTKMMTMLLAEEALTSGIVTLQTPIAVTAAAAKIGGSQVWLDPRETFPFGELLKAISIKSANDAAYLVGEYLGQGDVESFVQRMNARAKAIGMTQTQFYETHGLGDASKRNNKSSALDMVILAEHLLQYPAVIKLASTPMDSFRDGKTMLKNHNNLVFQHVPGVDGMKTGYTKASGFCITISCKRGGRRLLACVTGFPNSKSRDAFCKALLNWGYTQK